MPGLVQERGRFLLRTSSGTSTGMRGSKERLGGAAPPGRTAQWNCRTGTTVRGRGSCPTQTRPPFSQFCGVSLLGTARPRTLLGPGPSVPPGPHLGNEKKRLGEVSEGWQEPPKKGGAVSSLVLKLLQQAAGTFSLAFMKLHFFRFFFFNPYTSLKF